MSVNYNNLNSIIFTQDLDGERDWFSKKFPNYINLETIHSGKWPMKHPTSGHDQQLYEISFRDQTETVEFLDTPLPKYKSVFSNDKELIFKDKWWPMSDHVLHNLEFQNKVKSNDYIILNLTRSGTMFTKSLIDLKLNEFQHHESVGTYQKALELANIIEIKNLTVFLVYRKNSWEWCTSNLIAYKNGFQHYNTFNDMLVSNFITLETELDKLLEIQLATWNFWCNLKCAIPDLNCYLLEFSETVSKYQHLSEHVKIPYAKNKVISNYYELKEIFDLKYKKYFDKIIMNGSKHLVEMYCKTDLSDLDLENNSSIITS